MNLTKSLLLVSLILVSGVANAFQIASLAPQGEVSQVRRIHVRFDESAVSFGSPGLAAPLTLKCNDDRAAKGAGRWINDREWVVDYESDLPPGVSCSLQPRADLKSSKGEDLKFVRSYAFNTGGPFVQRIIPSAGSQIDEGQFFIMKLNGPATLASVESSVWCSVDGLGERVPVRLIDGKDRLALLKSQARERVAADADLSWVTLACNRRLTPSAKVQLVVGKGLVVASTSATAAVSVTSSVQRRFEFTVREPFMASFNCERENARADCLAIRPVSLNFNAPVTRAQAQGVRLQVGKESLKPSFDKEDADGDTLVNRVEFKTVLPEKVKFTIELPREFRDAAGRSLQNADSFPMTAATGAMPPLAKFAAAPFAIVERFAEGEGAALLPVTLRRVQPSMHIRGLRAQADQPGAPARLADLRAQSDADIIAWFNKVQRYDQSTVSRKVAAAEIRMPLPKVGVDPEPGEVQSRMLSLLAGVPGVTTLEIPQTSSGDTRPFEVVGIPLSPGFHVVEIASPELGASLLDERYGSPRTMYVRTSALVTNLGVHFKLGRENALAWVTSLDKGRPVPHATVRVSDCKGRELGNATTDAQGIAYLSGIDPVAPTCQGEGDHKQAYFVSARVRQAGVEDMAFTWSDWHRGIEPWRFNVPTSRDSRPDDRAHTILDRMLLRAGETVSMKHILRTETSRGFGLPATEPSKLVVTHVGSGTQYTQDLAWRKTGTGGRSAHSTFAIPPGAKLGVYEVQLQGAQSERSFSTGKFRVEEFRLPILQGQIRPVDRKPLVNVKAVPVDVQVSYVSGGAATGLAVRVSALVRDKMVSYADFPEFSFQAPRAAGRDTGASDEEDDTPVDSRVIADKLPVTLDKAGAGKISIDKVPAARQARELLLEASYADPNGEIQTIRSVNTLWPAAVVAGIRTEDWVSSGQSVRFQALALDLGGKVMADVALQVRAVARVTSSSRKRMVGGFYTYDNRLSVKDLGQVCAGKSDSRGLLLCEAKLQQSGEVELIVTATDAAGNSSQAASSVYVTKQGELWFGGENHDRMDLLPEKRSYEPGETAKFQVRMPFRFATALLAVEREGIMETQVVQLNGQDPTVSLKIRDSWGPNVYVSVLALRGRLREVPWYSFFTWGYRAPKDWWTSFWYEGRDYVAPNALVDLGKPAFRFGMAEIRVGSKAHQLQVSVKSDRETYPVRGQAKVTVQVRLPNGEPAAGAEVALAAVDQALLELMPNTSWDLLDAMMQRRSWGVETATAQMQIVGRRHYGRKALAPGGGGGHTGTRELFETLLLWNPAVKLDASGQAVVNVPLNDALTSFRIVAVADTALGLFGTGSSTIRSTQDLQIISGLPPLVREEDQFRAQFTLRNTTKQAMKVVVTPRATLLDLKAQTVDLPAQGARDVAWTVTAPAQLAQIRSEAILWEIEARDALSGARDGLKARQRIIAAVPLTVRQATLVQLDAPYSLDVSAPAEALAGRGGIRMSLQPRLAEGLPGVREWLASYPFACLEQRTSKALGLGDTALWQALLGQMPGYLDADGLLSYFPPRAGDGNSGSDTLTAYVLASAHEAATLNPAFALSEDRRAPMERGLVNFVEGRIQRKFWSPRQDLELRKLAAIEALSRYGKAQARMLGSITLAPNQWPTHAVIDWLSILKRVPDVPDRDRRLAEANQILRARLSFQGTRLGFSTEREDYWWWLMQSADLNSARLLLAVMDDPAWKDDLARLVTGFIARQQQGAWHTTTANLWGSMALEKFSARMEAVPVTGRTRAAMGQRSVAVDWSKVERNNSMFLPWSKAGAKETLTAMHQGSGRPWLTLQSLAAVQLKQPVNAGYQISKTIEALEQGNRSLAAGKHSRGDVLRVTLEVTASSDMSWVVITDPVPAGAAILGSGLGRDSEIATRGENAQGVSWSSFEERSFEFFRSYYAYLPKGTVKIQYTMRLNNAGSFSLPPSRVEAMYAPEMYGETPNARLTVEMVP